MEEEKPLTREILHNIEGPSVINIMQKMETLSTMNPHMQTKPTQFTSKADKGEIRGATTDPTRPNNMHYSRLGPERGDWQADR